MIPNLQILIHDNEQDRAACEQWWRDASETAKQRVWDAIQVSHADPVQEIISRLAQLAFGEMAEREARRKEPT